MCGRYANHIKDMHNWEDVLGDWPANCKTSHNVAPSQTVPVVIWHKDHPITVPMHWGLVPRWSREPKTKYSTFNARSETVAQKPAFRDAWRKRQTCLIPAQGYYEWRGPKGEKESFFIQREDQNPLVMAGLWEVWGDDDEHFYSCTILTQPASKTLIYLHPRMPVILKKSDASLWQTQIMHIDFKATPELAFAPKKVHAPSARPNYS